MWEFSRDVPPDQATSAVLGETVEPAFASQARRAESPQGTPRPRSVAGGRRPEGQGLRQLHLDVGARGEDAATRHAGAACEGPRRGTAVAARVQRWSAYAFPQGVADLMTERPDQAPGPCVQSHRRHTGHDVVPTYRFTASDTSPVVNGLARISTRSASAGSAAATSWQARPEIKITGGQASRRDALSSR